MISFFVAVFGFGFYKSKQNNSNGHTWVDFDPAKIEEYLINGQMVFIDITADWCFNCKVNKIVAIDRKDTVQFFKDNNIIGMRGNITSKNPVVLDFMSNNNINGIPYNAIYTINHKEGVAMPVILTSSILKTEIQKAMLN